MTGGTVVVLGETGRNFAAGMSGGAAFVYDPENKFAARINDDKNLLRESVTDTIDIDLLKSLITKHHDLTGSARAAELLADWDTALPKFVKVVSEEYKLLLAKRIATPLPMSNGDGNGGDGHGHAAGDPSALLTGAASVGGAKS